MINTLTGSNSFMLQQTLRQKVEAFLSEHGEFGLERIDGEEATYERMREAMTSLPFLVAKKLVVLLHPSAQKQFAESIAELLEIGTRRNGRHYRGAEARQTLQLLQNTQETDRLPGILGA
jgi:hypothetical protein